MKSKNEVIAALHHYAEAYAGENIDLIKNFVQNTSEEWLYSRNNFAGHITASAFIYCAAEAKLLLIYHSTLHKWLQPGGHVETGDETLEAAALREAIEETGLPKEAFTIVPGIADIDSHFIPANEKKQEPAHYHHDLRFLFTCSHLALPAVQHHHVSGCQWISMDALPMEESIRRVAQKITSLIFPPLVE